MPVDKLTIQQFSQKIKQQYPQYKDIEDSLLTQKIIDKYPQYKERVNYEVPKQATNISGQQPSNNGITPAATKDPNYLGLVGIPSIEEAAQRAKEKYGNAVLSSLNTVSDLLDNHESIKKIAKSILDDQVKRKVGEEVSKGLRQEPYQQFNFDMNPVKEEHIQRLAEDIKATPAMHVDALIQAKKIMPEKAADIDAAIYTGRANARAVNTEKKNQIAENDRLIKEKKIKYDPHSDRLIKPEDLGESLHTASKRRNDDMALFDLADNGSRENLIKKLNELVINQDPDVPTPEPSGFGGKVGEFMGGQAKITAQAFAAQAVNLVAPGSGEVLAAGLYAHEFARRGFSNELQRSYAAFKKQGLSDDEALDKAETQAKIAMTTDAATAAIMGKATSGAGNKLIKSATVKEATKLANEGGWYNGVIKSGFDFIKKEAPVGIKNASLAGGGELAKNIAADVGGQDRDVTEGAAGAAGNMLALHYTLSAGMGLLGHFGSKGIDATKPIYKKVMQGFTKVPIEDAKIIAAEQIQAGNITPQDAARVLEDIEAHKELDDLIPKSVKNDEVRLKLQDIVKKREATAEEKSKVSAAFAEPLKLKIEGYDQKINEIVNSPEAKQESPAQEPTEKTASDLLITAAVNGDVKGTYAEMVKSDPKQADAVVKDIAEQAQGIDSEGNPLPGGSRYEDMVKDYPKEIIDAAIKEYPKKKPVHTVSTPNIVNVKLKENAIPIGEPEKIPLGETSRDRGPVGEGIPQPEKSTGTQEEPIISSQESTQPQGVSSKEITGVTHAETDAVAREMGLPTYEEKPETIAEWDAEAAKRIKEDPETVNRLLNKLQKGVEPDKIEQRVMAKYLASLKAKFNETHSDEVMNEYARAKKLSDEIGGREVGKSLVARKALEPVEDSLTDFVYKEMEDNNAGLPLSEKQKETVTKEYEDFKSKKDAFEAHMKSKESEFIKREAELKIQEEVKKRKATKPVDKKAVKKTHEDYKAERTSYIEQLKELKAAAEKKLKDKGIQTMGINFTFNGDMAKVVGKMVKSLVEEGIDKLEEIVKHIHGQLKDVFEGIEETDVHDIIAGKYNDKKETRNEVAAKVQDIKTEAKLINEYSDLLFGKEPTKESVAKRRNITLEGLRKRIRSLADEKTPNAKEIKEKPDEAKSKLNAIKTRLSNELEKQKEKLASGNLEPDIKAEPIKLDTEGQKLRDELIKTKIDIEVARIKRKYENETSRESLGRLAIEVANAPRTIMSSMDLSAPLRQGLVAVAAHPVTSSKAMVKMIQAAKSQKVFDRWFYDLHESKAYQIMKDSHLAITDPHDPKLAAKEEAFMNNLAQKIPFIGKAIKYGSEGKSIGGLISGSERAYVLFLNKVRVDLFNRAVRAFQSDGKTFNNSPELYKALAEHINNITGRGSLGKHGEVVAPVLNTAFFSPRLMMSRINLLTNFMNPRFYKNVPVEVRKMYFADMAKFILAGAALLGAGKILGGQVETDPRSSDALKIKVNDTRYDVLGGFQQYIRLVATLLPFIGGKKSTKTGEIKQLDGEGAFGETRGDVIGRFLRGKLAPVPAMALDAISGRDMMGNKVVYDQGLSLHSPYKKEKTYMEEYGGSLLPLIFSDVKDAFAKEGVKSLATVGIPAAFGVGTMTYSDDTRPKRPTAGHGNKRDTKERSRK